MKKYLIMITSIFAIFGLTSCNEDNSNVAPTFIPQGVEYEVNLFERRAIITGTNEDFDSTTLILPAYIGRSRIISIEPNAFNDLNLIKVDLSHMTYLETIGYNAFRDNPITEVTFGNINLTSIGSDAFRYTKIQKLDFSGLENLETIGGHAFRGMGQEGTIHSVNFLNLKTLNFIGNSAFMNQAITEVKLIDLPKLSTIQQGAFSNNPIEEIHLINLPQLTTLPMQLFSGNTRVIEEGEYAINLIILDRLPQMTTISQLGGYALRPFGNPSLIGKVYIINYEDWATTLSWWNSRNVIFGENITLT